MTDNPGHLDDAPSDPAASKPRRRLLKLLRRSDTPLDVYQLADTTGLHITTVRFHLDVLARAGQVTVQKTPRTTPGRPRTVYTIRTEEASPDGYRPLASILAAHLGPTPRTRRRRAEKAGRDWATTLIPTADGVATPNEAAHRIVDLFTEMNFDPNSPTPHRTPGNGKSGSAPAPTGTSPGNTPTSSAPFTSGSCRAHSPNSDPPTTVPLVPFVKPHLCLAYLTPDHADTDVPRPAPSKSPTGT